MNVNNLSTGEYLFISQGAHNLCDKFVCNKYFLNPPDSTLVIDLSVDVCSWCACIHLGRDINDRDYCGACILGRNINNRCSL